MVHRHELRETLIRIIDLLMNPVTLIDAGMTFDEGGPVASSSYGDGEAALNDGEPAL